MVCAFGERVHRVPIFFPRSFPRRANFSCSSPSKTINSLQWRHRTRGAYSSRIPTRSRAFGCWKFLQSWTNYCLPKMLPCKLKSFLWYMHSDHVARKMGPSNEYSDLTTHLPSKRSQSQTDMPPTLQTRTQITVHCTCTRRDRPNRSRIRQPMHPITNIPHPTSPIIKLPPHPPPKSRPHLTSGYQSRRRRGRRERRPEPPR